MFKSNSNDNVTRSEARTYVEGLDSRITNLASQGANAFDDLKRRVSALEALASELRQGARAPLPTRTAASGDALTKADAERALHDLRQQSAYALAGLERKIDALTHRGSVTQQQTREAAPAGVDYGAVAFGLSQIKRDVTNLLGSETRSADLAEHYRQTVQYFADVFASTDPSFDADAFNRQAGV